MPPRRRAASLEVTVRGPNRREATYSASSVQSRTVPRQSMLPPPGPQTAATRRAVAPPTDVPTASVQRPPPSQRPPRPAKQGLTTLGHTDGNLQTSNQEEKATNSYSADKASKRSKEDRGQARKPRGPGDTQVQAQLVNSSGHGYPPVYLGPLGRQLPWVPSLRLSQQKQSCGGLLPA